MNLLAPHRACTTRRMAPHPVVLCLQDTTAMELNVFNISDLLAISDETQRGLYLHPPLAVSSEREPLGMLDAWMWAREPKVEDGLRPTNRTAADLDTAAERVD